MPLQIVRQDICKMEVDAIVNTTNRNMIGYSGVDLAVHTAAGVGLDAECAALAPLGVGQVKITPGFALPCKHIIHTVGPSWRGGLCGEEALLRACYVNSLKLALENGCESVAFPLISSGNHGYPKDQVLDFAVRVITEFLLEHEMLVYLCVFDRESYTFSQALFSDIQAFIDDEGVWAQTCEQKRVRFFRPRRGEQAPPPILSSCSLSPVGASRTEEAKGSLQEYVEQIDKGFREMLFDLIDNSGMGDVACYKKANVDKRVFSKIKSNKDYHPSKPTVIAFAISLHLNLEQTQDLLATAGFTLSNSSVFDKIIRYFILNEKYDIFEINQALFEFDQCLLGSF